MFSIETLMQVKEILALILGIITFVITTVTFLVKFIRANKGKIEEAKKANAATRAKMLIQFAMNAIQVAENIKSKSGDELMSEDKLKLALTEINQMCIDNGIAFDKEEATAIIEQCIDLTKKVNKRDKDKPAAANQPP